MPALTADALYEGRAPHRRATPSREFSPRVFLTYLDVDALPESIDALPGWSSRRAAPIRFQREDFFDGRDGPLGDAVRDLVEDRLGRRPGGVVNLLAQPRTFGWLANPLVAYYCWDANGADLDAIVLEVTNTPWGERHWYVLDARSANEATTEKAMHVSPFLPMDVEYRISWTVPGTALDLDIQVVRQGATVFSGGLALRRTVLNRRRVVTISLRYPLLPLRVSVGIYRRALALLVARAPRYHHPVRHPQEVGA